LAQELVRAMQRHKFLKEAAEAPEIRLIEVSNPVHQSFTLLEPEALDRDANMSY